MAVNYDCEEKHKINNFIILISYRSKSRKKSIFYVRKVGYMDILVITINYNNKQLTRECIESVVAKTKKLSFEIIVIDNASKDGSKSELSKLELENYTYIYNRNNVGFAKANNQASRIASGEYLFFMNNDMVFVNNVLYNLLEFMNKNNSIGIVGPKFLNSDGTLQISCRSFPSIKLGLIKFIPFLNMFFHKDLMKYYQKELDFNLSHCVETVSAGAVLISRQFFNNIGGFDEFSFMYGEDADICKRVRDLGYKVVYYPKAVLIHYGGQSSKLNSYKAIWSYNIGFYLLYKKYYFKKMAFFIKPFFVLRAIIELIFNFFIKDYNVTWYKK